MNKPKPPDRFDMALVLLLAAGDAGLEVSTDMNLVAKAHKLLFVRGHASSVETIQLKDGTTRIRLSAAFLKELAELPDLANGHTPKIILSPSRKGFQS